MTNTTRAARKVKAPTFLAPRPTLPEHLAATEAGRLIAAASVAMALMRKAKVSTIAELAQHSERIPASVRASAAVVADIERFAPVLSWLYMPVTGAKDAPATRYLVVCVECGLWLALSGAGVPARCSLTLGCTGRLTKASAATAPKPPALEAAEPSAPDDVDDELDDGEQ